MIKIIKKITMMNRYLNKYLHLLETKIEQNKIIKIINRKEINQNKTLINNHHDRRKKR